jgi:murein DD-endopeptidase MepM/ murein hydrolase activator NlpD
MARTVFFALIFLALFARSNGQEVCVPRDASKDPAVSLPPEKPNVAKQQPKEQLPKVEPVKQQIAKAQPAKVPAATTPTAKAESPAAASAKAQPVKTAPAIVQTMKAQPLKVAMLKTQPATTAVTGPAAAPVSASLETAFTKLADGFDFPVGRPDAQGYYKARGFRSKGHLGEDWDGVGGGDTDLGDPVYSIGDGIVVFARDCHMGWGNVLIVRHAYRDDGELKYIDALYGHLNSMVVKRGQTVMRGQQIATMGTAHGLYDAHLHLEIRRNLEIGMSRAKFARDFSNYYDPSHFILTHRHLQTSREKFRVALNTFKQDERIRWTRRNYSSYRGGSSESATALKKAVASQGH